MVQSSLNLAVVAVTDDVMPITKVLQVFPVAVWEDHVGLCLSPGCFAEAASGRGLGTGILLTAFPSLFDRLFSAQYLFDCIFVPFDRTRQKILLPNKMVSF